MILIAKCDIDIVTVTLILGNGCALVVISVFAEVNHKTLADQVTLVAGCSVGAVDSTLFRGSCWSYGQK